MIWRTFLRQRLPTALCPERGDHGGSELYWYRQMWRSAKFVEGFTQYSVQFSYSVVSDSLQPHEPQHARPASPSPTPGVYTNPCPSSQWCHPIISSSVIPFSSCPQSFPAAGSFQMSQLRWLNYWSFSFKSILLMSIQDWFPKMEFRSR